MDQVRTAIYYSFKRHGIEIPFPMQVEFERQEVVGRPPQTTEAFLDAVAHVPVFASLDTRRAATWWTSPSSGSTAQARSSSGRGIRRVDVHRQQG